MPLNGAGTRLVCSNDFGDLLAITVAVQPTGTYPTHGEDIAALLADPLMGDLVKQYVGSIPPVNVDIGNDNLGHPWSYDPALLTMGALRNWTVLGATPTEHTNVGYDPGESAAVFRVTFYFPKFRTSTA